MRRPRGWEWKRKSFGARFFLESHERGGVGMVRKSVWLAVVAAGALLAGSAGAWDHPMEYQFEAGARLSLDPTGNEVAVPFTYFINGVEDTEKPFALQPFFGKASSVGVNLVLGPTPADLDVPMLFTLPVEEDSLYLTGNVDNALDQANITFSLGVGYYIMENFRLDMDVLTGGGGAAATWLGDLNLEYVQEIGDEGALDIQGRLELAGAGDLPTLELGAMFYINKEFGIGVGYNNLPALTVDVSYYIGPLAIVGGYDLTNGVLLIGADYRF